MITEKNQQGTNDHMEKPQEKVFFQIMRDSVCGRCHTELHKGSFLYKDGEEALCVGCAGFDDFIFLPAGNAKLTRRAKKYSKVCAVVVKFSRARKRYERQGLLLEEFALQKAENELQAT